MFLAAQKIWKIVTESKVTVLSPSLAAEENHLRFCMKKKLKNIDSSKFDFNAGVKLYINKCLWPISQRIMGEM